MLVVDAGTELQPSKLPINSLLNRGRKEGFDVGLPLNNPNRTSGSDFKKSDKKRGRNNSNDLCAFCAEAIMCHELGDGFIFGAFNVL